MHLARNRHPWRGWLPAVFALASSSWAAPSIVERLTDEVLVVRDDAGNWGGGSMGITHQNHAEYQAKKLLDLSSVPADFWKAASQVRLSVFFCVRDYSWRAKPKPNGLDEAIEVVVNGKPHRYETKARLPVYDEKKPMGQCMRWHDFALPKSEFVRGPNEIVFRKVPAEGKVPDDYLYLGIDNTVPSGTVRQAHGALRAPKGRSWVKLGKDADWRQDKLTIPGGKGEYMVRLYLLRGESRFQAVWHAADSRFDDPHGILEYAGSHGDATRVEWDPLRLDRLSPVTVVVETSEAKPFDFQWLDANGEPVGKPVQRRGPRYEARLAPPLPFRPSGVSLPKGLPLKAVTLAASRDYHPLPRRVDMAPRIAAPKGASRERKPECAVQGHRITLADDTLRCTFETSGGRLRLTSLYNELAAAEMARRPEDCALFLVEVEGKRYAGSRDFACRSISPMSARPGFDALLACDAVGLEAHMQIFIADQALRLHMDISNRSEKPVAFKVAFPHLSGLALSQKPADDYYFFPWGGGIFSDAPALIRRGYGDHEAIYQVMDIFSPKRGAGLAVWCTDADGRYKVLALRKHIPGQAEENGDRAMTPTAEEFKWTNSLSQVPGIGLTYEYLRRTRKPGESFAPKDVAIRAHAGDWHAAMKLYADWCHRVWKFRPYPNRLTPVVNMLAAGWGRSPLYATPSQTRVSEDCGYRTDFIKPRCDCIELMSWWEWSFLGPWRTPLDKVEDVLGEAKAKRWKSYFVKDPVTGKPMFSNQPGDYDGYNQRWGGLPALREAIETYRKMGALVTLYTDPIRCDDGTKTGRKYGKLWGIVKPDGKYRDNYDVWNMCHDVAEYRQWVADTMRRVMRETDADGIRLDEYGHRGAACFSKLHKHTFAEHGCTEWQRCIAETTKLVRQAMDEAKPGSVLTTEHPGHDFLMPFIEGCITYDLTVQATPLRPLEVNLQRFYFPECKAYELDHRGADRGHRKRFWNAVAAFGSYYPLPYDTILRENAEAFASRDCTPLIPTDAKRVYCNRFRANGKAVHTLYNATGHTFAGPVLSVRLREGEHLFDLLACKEADCEARDGRARVSLYMPRDGVACLARLCRSLTVKRIGDSIAVVVQWKLPESLGVSGPSLRLALCDRDGRCLVTQPAGGRGAHAFDLGQLPKDARPACVKLLRGGLLEDVATVPQPK